jgi:hypothetical protein
MKIYAAAHFLHYGTGRKKLEVDIMHNHQCVSEGAKVSIPNFFSLLYFFFKN